MKLQVQSLWSIVRELNVGELRSALNQSIQIAVLGSTPEEQAAVADLLLTRPRGAIDPVDPPRMSGMSMPFPAADLYLVVSSTGGPTPQERTALESLVKGSTPVVLIFAGHGLARAGGLTRSSTPAPAAVLDIDLDYPEDGRRQLAGILFNLLGPRGLALARQFSGLREPIVDRLIRDTSLANAQFALLSTLPNWIPLVGGLAGTSADLLILTKNQVLLVLKLAGLYGRDLGRWRQILIEITPVVGGAFAWRSAARTLVGLLPAPVAVAPKATIAYVGTMTVGEIARHYYRDGVPIDRHGVREIQERALARFRSMRSRLPTSSG